MAYSKSINIYLPSGTSDGIIKVRLANWNGRVIKIPRKEVSDYKENELSCPGVYFLFCEKDNNSTDIYVGETEDLLKRLKQHIQLYNADKEKFYWQTAVCVKGEDLDKALIRYLENYYCDLIKKSTKYTLLTQSSSPNVVLKEDEKAVMVEFIDYVNMLMKAIGFGININVKVDDEQKDLLYFKSTNIEISAKGYVSSNGFVVLKGSKVNPVSTSQIFINGPSNKLKQKLIEKEILVDNTFTEDYTFTSPSSAAKLVMASNISGNEYWVNKDGIKLKDLEF